MNRLLGPNDLVSIPAKPVTYESRLDGEKLGWFHAYNLSPYVFEVWDDSGQVRGISIPGELVLPLLVRTERILLNPIATMLGAFPLAAANYAVYVEVTEQKPETTESLPPDPGSTGSPEIVRLEDGSAPGNFVGLASAANLIAESSVAALLELPPGEWTAVSTPAVGTAASASRAAGAAGVRHVARRVSFGFSATTALAAIVTVTINLRDGATGAGAILWSWQFTLPAAVIGAFAIEKEVNFPGSPATAMTLEFAANVANLLTFANLGGTDAS